MAAEGRPELLWLRTPGQSLLLLSFPERRMTRAFSVSSVDGSVLPTDLPGLARDAPTLAAAIDRGGRLLQVTDCFVRVSPQSDDAAEESALWSAFAPIVYAAVIAPLALLACADGQVMLLRCGADGVTVLDSVRCDASAIALSPTHAAVADASGRIELLQLHPRSKPKLKRAGRPLQLPPAVSLCSLALARFHAQLHVVAGGLHGHIVTCAIDARGDCGRWQQQSFGSDAVLVTSLPAFEEGQPASLGSAVLLHSSRSALLCAPSKASQLSVLPFFGTDGCNSLLRVQSPAWPNGFLWLDRDEQLRVGSLRSDGQLHCNTMTLSASPCGLAALPGAALIAVATESDVQLLESAALSLVGKLHVDPAQRVTALAAVSQHTLVCCTVEKGEGSAGESKAAEAEDEEGKDSGAAAHVNVIAIERGDDGRLLMRIACHEPLPAAAVAAVALQDSRVAIAADALLLVFDCSAGRLRRIAQLGSVDASCITAAAPTCDGGALLTAELCGSAARFRLPFAEEGKVEEGLPAAAVDGVALSLPLAVAALPDGAVALGGAAGLHLDGQLHSIGCVTALLPLPDGLLCGTADGALYHISRLDSSERGRQLSALAQELAPHAVHTSLLSTQLLEEALRCDAKRASALCYRLRCTPPQLTALVEGM
eukprot:PLAT3591.2.p1 GENE.PLAT3591.2~~PLAT3591.2.p1  ORF type:complete len:675 (+),score=245.64 PLAT3591.2:65-2026(+)